MSNPFKSIGKVFKSVVNVVKKVVKGAFKLVKKIAPAALLIGGLALGAAFLTGGLAAGGTGIFGSVGTFLTEGVATISQGLGTIFGGGAAAAAPAAAGAVGGGATLAGSATGLGSLGAAGSGGLLSGLGSTAGVASAFGAAPVGTGTVLAGAGGGGLLSGGLGSAVGVGAAYNAAAPTLGATLWNGAKGVGNFALDAVKNNPFEAIKVGSGVLDGLQKEKIAEEDRDEDARQFDAKQGLNEQIHDDNVNFNGSLYGVDTEGVDQGSLGQLNYTAQQPVSDPNAGSDRLNQRYEENANGTPDLLEFYRQAFYNRQGA